MSNINAYNFRNNNIQFNEAIPEAPAGAETVNTITDRILATLFENRLSAAIVEAYSSARSFASRIVTAITSTALAAQSALTRLYYTILTRSGITESDALRENTVAFLSQNTPNRAPDAQIERTLFEVNGELRLQACYKLTSVDPNRLSDELIERVVFGTGKFNQVHFSALSFTSSAYLRNDYLNRLPVIEIEKLDGRLFSVLPDNILEELNAEVLNNLTDDNKAKLRSMRIFAKLSDTTFGALDRSVLSHDGMIVALSRAPKVFFEMPEWRKEKIAESRTQA